MSVLFSSAAPFFSTRRGSGSPSKKGTPCSQRFAHESYVPHSSSPIFPAQRAPGDYPRTPTCRQLRWRGLVGSATAMCRTNPARRIHHAWPLRGLSMPCCARLGKAMPPRWLVAARWRTFATGTERRPEPHLRPGWQRHSGWHEHASEGNGAAPGPRLPLLRSPEALDPSSRRPHHPATDPAQACHGRPVSRPSPNSGFPRNWCPVALEWWPCQVLSARNPQCVVWCGHSGAETPHPQRSAGHDLSLNMPLPCS
jgi:hypothetical protein